MKYYLLLITLLLLGSISSTGQIPTPDFRYYTSCPTSHSQVNRCTGWRQPTWATSDYFNVCDTGMWVGVPRNYFGYQTSYLNAYTGLYTCLHTDDYKEYIATDIQPLSIGRTYTMTITVSLSDSSTYATDGLGVFFTTYPINRSLATTLLVTPQIDYSNYGIIKDMVNWVTLAKTFVADSAYTHLTVGCFKPYGTMLMDSLVDGGKRPAYSRTAYYYIGQIGVPDSTRHSYTDYVTPADPTGPYPVDTTIIATAETGKYVFPNAFTPNNDGSNEIFRIISRIPGILAGYSLSIYNRWGNRVFFTTDTYSGWNGTYNIEPQDIGTYFYLCAFTVNGEHKILKGDVTLLR